MNNPDAIALALLAFADIALIAWRRRSGRNQLQVRRMRSLASAIRSGEFVEAVVPRERLLLRAI